MNTNINRIAFEAANMSGANLMTQDPKFVKELVRLVLLEVNSIVWDEATSESSAARTILLMEKHFGVEE